MLASYWLLERGFLSIFIFFLSMKQSHGGNYAFIDNENVNMSVQKQGWKMDWGKLRQRLEKTFNVTKAYMFMGYSPEHQEMYTYFQQLWYVLIFKPMTHTWAWVKKWNVDAELVLQAMIDIQEYDKAVVVTGDGDFACLVRYLYGQDKLATLVVPNQQRYSDLLNHAAKEKMISFTSYRSVLSYRMRSHASAPASASAPDPALAPASASAPDPALAPASASASSGPSTAPTPSAASRQGDAMEWGIGSQKRVWKALKSPRK
jgi:uncharacterized LabA/DUF88 family protein